MSETTSTEEFRFQLRSGTEGGRRRTSVHLERFHELVGREVPQSEVARRLRLWVQSEKAPVVGALHATCSDAAEQECVDEFQRQFARYMLPSLKFFEKTAFRTCNLGGRYEWGSVRIAESHFALAKGAADWKLLVVKLNAHVSVVDGPGGRAFGHAQRFGGEAEFCDAIHALLAGAALPFATELEEVFASEGKDRLAMLRDPASVKPELAGLFGAALNARLQARRAMMDLQDHAQHTPTLTFVLPCLSLNRPQHDTEILLGFYASDRRGEVPHEEYRGLSDDPSRFELVEGSDGLRLVDPQIDRPRLARDHRAMVLDEWHRVGLPLPEDPRLQDALRRADEERQTTSLPHAKTALSAMLPLLIELAPAPAAAVLFGSGLVRIHNAHKAHALLEESQRDAAARAMLRDVQQRIDGLSPEEARHTIALLLDAYRG